MALQDWSASKPDAVLDFWFPESGHEQDIRQHGEFWRWRMQGHADEAICSQFGDLTEAAAKGNLDHWAATPRGRLALIIALDQFPRSYWRGTPGAYAQDIKATGLALEGFRNGHYNALPNVWERQFCLIAVSHCEGPDHLDRMDMLLDMAKELAKDAPEHLRKAYLMSVEQTMTVRGVIAKYGRHPHRNAILGRISTNAEEEYIAAGSFPHERSRPSTPEGVDEALKKAGLLDQ